MSSVTRSLARDVLRDVWVNKHTIDRATATRLQHEARPGETLLATCARLAEVDVSGVIAYDHESIAQRLRAAEQLTDAAARDREKAKDV